MGRWRLIIYSMPIKSFTVQEEISEAVVRHGLDEFVRVCPYRKGYEDFYVIISVGRHNTDMPDTMREKAKNLLRSYELYVPDWRSSDYEGEHGNANPAGRLRRNGRGVQRSRRIKFKKPDAMVPSDPLSYDDENKTHSESCPDQTEDYNKLLQWLSGHGQGRWEQFKAACKALEVDPNGKSSSHIARRLRLLGHIELGKRGKNWFIAPPSLVATESKDGRYHTFFAGQRSLALLEDVQGVAQVELEAQPCGDAPELARAVFSSQAAAKQFTRDSCGRVYLAGQASIRIARALPSLANWERDLYSPMIAISKHKFEQWIEGRFESILYPQETGMYRLTKRATDYRNRAISLFYDARQERWIRADWYGLRYLMLRRTGEIVEFHYDHNVRTLSIDSDQRLPHMYERALVLSSGRLPVRRNDRVVFGEVSAESGRALAEKLEARFIA